VSLIERSTRKRSAPLKQEDLYRSIDDLLECELNSVGNQSDENEVEEDEDFILSESEAEVFENPLSDSDDSISSSSATDYSGSDLDTDEDEEGEGNLRVIRYQILPIDLSI
jgi:hypothetical protein